MAILKSLRLYDQALAPYLARAAGWPGVWSPPTMTSGRRPRTSCGSVSRPRQPGWLKDVHWGLKELLAQSLLTPACGTGLYEPGRQPPGVDHPQGVGHPRPGVAGVSLTAGAGRHYVLHNYANATYRPPHFTPSPPEAVGEGVGWGAGFFMMAGPQIGPIFSLSLNGGGGQGEGEVSFTE